MDILNVLDQIYSDPAYSSHFFPFCSTLSVHPLLILPLVSSWNLIPLYAYSVLYPFISPILFLHPMILFIPVQELSLFLSDVLSFYSILCHSFVVSHLSSSRRVFCFLGKEEMERLDTSCGHSFLFKERKSVSQRQTFVLLPLCTTFFLLIMTFLLFFFFSHVLSFFSLPLSVSPSLSFSQYSISIINHFLFMLTQCRYKHKRGGHEKKSSDWIFRSGITVVSSFTFFFSSL